MKWIAAVLVLFLVAAPLAQADGKTLNTSEEIAAALETIKLSVDFDNTPLPDVLSFLVDYTRINMLMSRDLQERHSDEEILVKLQVKDLPLQNVLRLLRSMYALKIDYNEGVLMFRTDEEIIESDFKTQIYRVDTITAKLPDFPGAEISLGEDGEVILDTFDDEDNVAGFDEDTLIELIQRNTGMDNWDADEASITYENGLLVVRQTPEIHTKIRKLLARLD
jgi:hypothetical protein